MKKSSSNGNGKGQEIRAEVRCLIPPLQTSHSEADWLHMLHWNLWKRNLVLSHHPTQ